MTLVVFATEYDTANIVFSILSQTITDYLIYPLLIKHRPSKNVYFCLQTQKCDRSKRIQTVFICRDETLHLSKYIIRNIPIHSNDIIKALNIEETEKLYDGILTKTTKAEFKHTVFFNKDILIKHLLKKYKVPTSPFWFIATYGQTEGGLLLTMYYYLFEEQRSTIQTTKDYVKCFLNDFGGVIFTYSSMIDFMKILIKSKFKCRIAPFVRYAMLKNARDREELNFVDEEIKRFTENIHLNDTSHVHYIYLAYNTVLNKQRLIKYTVDTAYDETLPSESQCKKDMLMLGKSLKEELISVMNKYFNIDTYFANYIDVCKVSAADLKLKNYAYDGDSDRSEISFATSDRIAETLETCNSQFEGLFSTVKTTLQGLLHVSASEKQFRCGDVCTKRRQYVKRGAEGPFPVFRIELPPNKHVFCYGTSESWIKNMDFGSVIKDLSHLYYSDEDLTNSVWLKESFYASTDAAQAFYQTRHEIFNEKLPVTNYIGDMDLILKKQCCLSKKQFFDMCRRMRMVFMTAWKNMFPGIDVDEYPVFFFKTKCDSPDAEDGCFGSERPVFCMCTRKIGIRVIIPFPAGVAVVGGGPLKQISKILNHVICLDRDFVSQVNDFVHLGDSFDTGVYNNGHSLRMGYMYKLEPSTSSLYGRLIPIFIVPAKRRSSPHEFVKEQLSLENLLHHGRNIERFDEIIYNIVDKGCPRESKSFIDTRNNMMFKRSCAPMEDVLLMHLQKHEVYMTDTGDNLLMLYTKNVAWPRLREYIINNYEERVTCEFTDVIFHQVNNNLVQVKKFNLGRVLDFRCLKNKHRGDKENVQVFIDVKTDFKRRVTSTLWSRCFANKCNSNTKHVHISVTLQGL